MPITCETLILTPDRTSNLQSRHYYPEFTDEESGPLNKQSQVADQMAEIGLKSWFIGLLNVFIMLGCYP